MNLKPNKIKLELMGEGVNTETLNPRQSDVRKIENRKRGEKGKSWKK
jgi:hypothetical protein